MIATEKNDRFQAALTRLLQTHVVEAERYQIRTALMWLAVALRPVRAAELWMAIVIEGNMNVEFVESYVDETRTVDDAEAMALIKGLVGDLITFRADGAGRYFASLADPDLPAYMTALDVNGDLGLFAFNPKDSHMIAACICFMVCTSSVMRTAHVHNNTVASSLVAYAWAHWSEHLSLSEYQLSNEHMATMMDSMIFCISTDILAFLLTLNDFITGPVTFPASDDYMQSVALVGKAQLALEQPIKTLSKYVQNYGCSRELQSARSLYEASRGDRQLSEHEKRPLHAVSSSTVSKTSSLLVDDLIRKSSTYFGQAEWDLVNDYARIARSIREVCVVFSQPPIYEELSKEFENWSPIDTLVSMANFAEGIASYPYWNELPRGTTTTDAFDITNPQDPNYQVAQLIRSRLRKADTLSESKEQKSDKHLEMPPTLADQKPSQFTKMRWHAAMALERFKNTKAKITRGSTFTLNDLRTLSQRTTSFASIPAGASGGDPFQHVSPLIPNALRRFYRKRLSPVVNWLNGSGMMGSLDSFGGGAFTGGMANLWPNTKIGVLSDGYGVAAVHFLLAVLLNHLRRMFVPWLGTYMFYHPLEDLRLALSNPDVYLNQALSVSYTWILAHQAQKYLVDLFGGCMIGFIAVNCGRWPDAMVEPLRRADPRRALWLERAMHAVKVGYLFYCFMNASYILDRISSTVAFLIAAGKLLFGGDAEHIALGRLLRRHLFVLPTLGYQVYSYAMSCIWPLAWGSVVCAVVGQPGLLFAMLLVSGTVYALLRYRAKFYIALELSGMFVVAGLLLVSGVLLAVEFVDDPLGLKAGTSRARRVGSAAKGLMPIGGTTRANVLRGQKADPIMMPSSWTAENEVPRAAEEKQQQPIGVVGGGGEAAQEVEGQPRVEEVQDAQEGMGHAKKD